MGNLPNLARLILDRFSEPRERPEDDDHRSEIYGMGLAITRQLYDMQRGESPPLRLSAAGRCARANAYALSGTPKDGKELDGRSRVTFAMGDVAELLVVHSLAETIGEFDGGRYSLQQVGAEQQRVWLFLDEDIDPIPGHPDGFICRDEIPFALLEVKSTSSFGFNKASKALEAGECPWGRDESYWWQSQAYMAALDLPLMGVVMLSKDSGMVLSFWLERDPEFLDLFTAHIRMSHLPPEEVPRVLPDGTELKPREDWHRSRPGVMNRRHGELSWRCRFCAWHTPCWSAEGLRKTVVRDYRGAPALALHVGRGDQ